MAMCLNESRHHAAGTKVNGLSVGADEGGNLGAVTHGDDSAIGHGECLGGGPGVVDGQHRSGYDDICGGHGQKA
jgi:hypothetical protein